MNWFIVKYNKLSTSSLKIWFKSSTSQGWHQKESWTEEKLIPFLFALRQESIMWQLSRECIKFGGKADPCFLLLTGC